MRFSTALPLLGALIFASSATSLLVLPSFFNPRSPTANTPVTQKQAVMGSNDDHPRPDHVSPSSADGPVTVSDVIGIDGSINIFAGFTRDIDAIADRLQNPSLNTTVLAPLNSAITSLPRKPWEDQRDYSSIGAAAYEGEEGEDRAHINLRRFVEAHVVPTSPWKEGEKVHTAAGSLIWWESKGGKKKIQPADIEVASIANRVANGEIWVIKAVNKDS